MNILGDLLFFIQFLDNIDIVGIRSFKMDLVFKRLFNHERKMRTLGTVAVKIFALVFVFFKRVGKHRFRLLYLHADLGKKTDL